MKIQKYKAPLVFRATAALIFGDAVTATPCWYFLHLSGLWYLMSAALTAQNTSSYVL